MPGWGRDRSSGNQLRRLGEVEGLLRQGPRRPGVHAPDGLPGRDRLRQGRKAGLLDRRHERRRRGGAQPRGPRRFSGRRRTTLSGPSTTPRSRSAPSRCTSRGCGRNITPGTSVRSSVTRTATTSRPSFTAAGRSSLNVEQFGVAVSQGFPPVLERGHTRSAGWPMSRVSVKTHAPSRFSRVPCRGRVRIAPRDFRGSPRCRFRGSPRCR